MSIASFDPQQDTVVVTPAAAAHFKRITTAKPGAARLRGQSEPLGLGL